MNDCELPALRLLLYCVEVLSGALACDDEVCSILVHVASNLCTHLPAPPDHRIPIDILSRRHDAGEAERAAPQSLSSEKWHNLSNTSNPALVARGGQHRCVNTAKSD